MGLAASQGRLNTVTCQKNDTQKAVMDRNEEKNWLHMTQTNRTTVNSMNASNKRAALDKKYEQIAASNPVTDEDENVETDFAADELSNLTTEQSIAKLKEEQEIDNEEQQQNNQVMAETQRKETFIDTILSVLEPRIQALNAEYDQLKELLSVLAQRCGEYFKNN